MSQIARRSDDAFFKEPRKFQARDAKGWPIGPRTKKGMEENRKLNKLPPEVKRRCELRVPGVCIGDRFLQWCHAVKRRFLVTDRDWQEAARGCAACHDYADKQPHKDMARMVREAIAKRKVA